MARISVREGDRIDNKYRVEHVLGAGGMGVVVAALHEALGNKVAIKLLLPDTLSSDEMLERFQREGRAAAKLRSDHVAHVFDVGVLDDGAPYMVMEYLEGRDLSDVVRSHGPLPLGVAARVVVQACEAIGEAHRASIIHRDIKPSNLFLTSTVGGTPRIKVLDFGVSKLKERDPSDQVATTQTTAVMGSPLYMSPEQMRSSKDVDRRSDIWSLGVVLYELLSGTTPWSGGSILEVAAAVLNAEPPDLSTRTQNVPTKAADIIKRCLSKDPDGRFGSVEELAGALKPFSERDADWDVYRVLGEGAKLQHEAIGPQDETVTIGSAPTEPAVPKAASTGAKKPATVSTTVGAVADVAPTDESPAGSKTGMGVAVAVAATLAVAGILIYLDIQRQLDDSAPSSVSVVAPPSGQAPASSSAAPAVSAADSKPKFALAYPCADNADGREKVTWCDLHGKQIAVCARGLVPVGKTGICGCAPGGTDAGDAAEHCPRPKSQQKRTVVDVVRGFRPALRDCTSDVDPMKVHGEIEITVKVAPDGRVYETKVTESAFHDVATQECILKIASTAVFPPPSNGHADLVIPMQLRNKK